ncbi:hypothetical protein ACTZWW_16065 [Salinarimonas sp. NSM]|uniref:hypothetical protein n=1 Tax=Salinarimonas sp. NSM TaxID=3458003 RepID=UPI0040371C53
MMSRAANRLAVRPAPIPPRAPRRQLVPRSMRLASGIFIAGLAAFALRTATAEAEGSAIAAPPPSVETAALADPGSTATAECAALPHLQTAPVCIQRVDDGSPRLVRVVSAEGAR